MAELICEILELCLWRHDPFASLDDDVLVIPKKYREGLCGALIPNLPNPNK